MDEPKRHVVEDYPAERLPDDLRKDIGATERVRVTVEAELDISARRSISEILDDMENERSLSDDPVERIRALRAGWDHREELHERIRRGEDV